MVRIGHGYDVHRLTEDRKLILCGVEIPYTLGLLGHSDADVALHALMDALLGAAALGDIGQHFPDTAEEYAGADSLMLARRVAEIMTEHGWRIENIDATILCQRPKLAPHIPAMRAKLAEAFGMPVDAVSVKATTEEHLGFTGEGLGIAMSDQISGALTVNLGIIRGGGEELSLTLDLRWPVTARYEDFADRLMGAMERGGFAGERTEGQDSIYMPPESPLVQALSKVYREQTGQEAELLSIGGGTYAKACPNLVAFGPLFPGQEMTEHQPDEYMEADTLLKNAQMMAAAIWELAR